MALLLFLALALFPGMGGGGVVLWQCREAQVTGPLFVLLPAYWSGRIRDYVCALQRAYGGTHPSCPLQG